MTVVSKNFIFLTFAVLVLGGCSSPPPRVDAKIPLVHSTVAFSLNKNEAKNVPESMGPVVINGINYEPAQQYTSVTGRNCMVLTVNSDTTPQRGQQQRACQFDGQWQLLPPLIQSTAR